MSPSLISPTRNRLQAFLLAFFFLLPFIRINGNPFIRLDVLSRTFFFAGIPLRVDEFYLVLLATLSLTSLFALVTVLLGRVWCGWLCPQTVINDLSEAILALLTRIKFGRPLSGTLHRLAMVLFSLSGSAVLLTFLFEPGEIVKRLSNPAGHPVIAATFFLTALAIYLDLIFVRRSFCRSYCPYGRLQAAVITDSTLALSYHEHEADRCIRCGSCVRTCPMGIDIRKGFQIECINCGRCLDACRTIMARKDGNAGLIGYHFGAPAGKGFRMTGAVLFLSALVAAGTAATVWSAMTRTMHTFSVQRHPAAPSKTLPDGTELQPWRAIIENRSQQRSVCRIEARAADSGNVGILGPVNPINIPGNDNRQVDFFLSIPGPGKPVQLQLYCGSSLTKTITLRP